jgi:hypothetical protein
MTATPGLVTSRMAVGLVLVSIFSLCALVALSAYAPDLRPESDGGAHVLSKSAVGFAGLRRLLEASGIPVEIDRGLFAREGRKSSLIIRTLPQLPKGGASDADLRRAMARIRQLGAQLDISPKWLTMPDPQHRGWVRKIVGLPLAPPVKKNGKRIALLDRRNGVTPVTLQPDPHELPRMGAARIAPVDQLQTMQADNLTPVISAAPGQAVLLRMKQTRFYVLSDPDLMDNHGLRDEATARAALAIIEQLREGDGPVVFDVTVNGFRRSPSLLRDALEPPFLGATIAALLAALLMGVHAFSRFGTPPAPPRHFALGKQALADNTAALVRNMGREAGMARRYAQATRAMVLEALGIRRELNAEQADALLAKMEKTAHTDAAFAALALDAEFAHNGSDLIRTARKLYEWRQGMTGEH